MSTAELDSALKSTLHSLSLVLSYHSTVQSLGVAQYAAHAPRQHVQQIRIDSDKFETVCAAIEQKLLRAIAVLERDGRKAAGEPPLVPTPPPVVDQAAPIPIPAAADELSAVVYPFGFHDLSALSVSTDQATAAANADSGAGPDVDMDDSFLNDSLFGDSVVASPIAGATAGDHPLPLTFDLSALAPPVETDLPPVAMPDLAALLALVGGANAPGAAPPTFPLPQQPLPASSGVDINYSSIDPFASFPGIEGMDFSSLDAGAGGAAGVGGAVDFSTLDFGSMGNFSDVDLNELLKSLGDGTG